jgi:predicted nucleic acid-binding protein
LRRIIAAKGYPELIVDGVRRLLEDLEVEALVEDVEYREAMNVATSLKLLPSAAIIALTCKHYGIDTILTFDEDFK